MKGVYIAAVRFFISKATVRVRCSRGVIFVSGSVDACFEESKKTLVCCLNTSLRIDFGGVAMRRVIIMARSGES